MRIGLDFISESTNSAGSMTYGKNLLRELAGQYPEDNFTVFINKECRSSFEVKNENIKYVEARNNFNKIAVVRRIAQQIWLPFVAKKHKLDLLHSINNVIPFGYAGKRIVTILDMTAYIQPKRFGIIKKGFLKYMVPVSARKADAVVTISNYVKEQIVDICKIPADKVVTAYCGADDRKYDNGLSLTKHDLSGKYLLFVGTLEPGKNVVRIIQAYNLVRQGGHEYLKLLIVGRKGWRYDDIFSEVMRLGINDKVIFLGKITDGEIVQALKNASVFVFPSLDEGFGLPVLEAMSFGCPVVTSNNSALPEIAGNAALLVNPYDISSIADAVLRVLNDSKLREDLIRGGKIQANKFTWKRTASIIHQQYCMIAK